MTSKAHESLKELEDQKVAKKKAAQRKVYIKVIWQLIVHSASSHASSAHWYCVFYLVIDDLVPISNLVLRMTLPWWLGSCASSWSPSLWWWSRWPWSTPRRTPTFPPSSLFPSRSSPTQNTQTWAIFPVMDMYHAWWVIIYNIKILQDQIVDRNTITLAIWY